MRIRAYTVAAAVLAVAAGLGTAGVAAASQAAPLGSTSACYSSPSAGSCDNTDPFNNSGNPGSWCGAGSYVANSQPVYYYDLNNGQINYSEWTGYIQNWYSPHCGTNWARYVNTSGLSGNVTIWVCRPGRCSDYYTSRIFPAWSNQVYAPTVTATAYAEFSADNGITAEGNAGA